MQAYQFYYTSCRKGQLGGAGFQTRTRTDGLPPADERELIERWIEYTPPRNFQRGMSFEEIAMRLPRACRCVRLTSGRLAVVMSTYAGRDYSGREGNFFAHAIVLPELPDGLWPMDFYEWSGWKHYLTPDEDTTDVPPLLPPLNTDEIPPSVSLTLDKLREFLTEDPERQPALESMIRAVFAARIQARAIVIRDEILDNVYWIACLQKAFPRRPATSLSMSTYQYGSRGAAAVNGTVSDSEFEFTDTDRRYQYFAYDFLQHQFSDVPATGEDYAKTITEWMCHQSNKLEAFHKFGDLFDGSDMDDGLDKILHLYLWGTGERPLDNVAEFTAALGYAQAHGLARAPQQMLEHLGALSSALGKESAAPGYRALGNFFADVANRTQSSEAVALAAETWCDAVMEIALTRHILADDLILMRKEICDLCSSAPEAILRALADGKRQGKLFTTLTGAPLHVYEYFLREVTDILRLTGQTEPWKDPTYVQVIRNALARNNYAEEWLRAVFHVASAQPAGIIAIGDIVNTAQQNEGRADRELGDVRIRIGRAIAAACAGKPADYRKTLRSELANRAMWDVLFGEAVGTIIAASDPTQGLAVYRRDVLPTLADEFQQNYGWRLGASMLEGLPEERRAVTALEWIKEEKVNDFPTDVQKRCADWANLALSFDPVDDRMERDAQTLAEFVRHLNHSLRPDRPKIRTLCRGVQRDVAGIADAVRLLPGELVGLDEETYRRFLRAALPRLLYTARTPDDLESVLKMVAAAARQTIFLPVYKNMITDKDINRTSGFFYRTTVFWLSQKKSNAPAASISAMKDGALEALRAALADLDRRSLEKLDAQLAEDKDFTSAAKGQWQKLFDTIQHQRPTLLDKILNLFGGKPN